MSEGYVKKKAGNLFFLRGFNAPMFSRHLKFSRERSLCIRKAYSAFLAEILVKLVKL